MAGFKPVSHAQDLNAFRGIIPEKVNQGVVTVRIEYPDGVTETLSSRDAHIRVEARRPGLQDKERKEVPHWEISLHLTLPMERIPEEEL